MDSNIVPFRPRRSFVGEHHRCPFCGGSDGFVYVGAQAWRAIRRASKIRRQLGSDPGIVAPFPGKPKGMWQRTYERLRERAIEAEIVANHAFAIQAERLLAGLDRRKRRKGFWR